MAILHDTHRLTKARDKAAAFSDEAVRIPLFFRVGFLALVALSILWPRYFFVSVGGFGVNPYTLGILVAAAAGLSLLVVYPPLARHWVKSLVRSKLIIVLLVAAILWRFAAASLGTSSAASTGLWLRETLYLAMIFLPASIFFLDRRCIHSCAGLLLVCLAIVCIIGIFDSVVGDTFVNRIGLINWAAGDQNLLYQAVYPEFRDGIIRAQSVFSHPIVFGQIIAALLPLGIAALSHSRLSQRVIAIMVLIMIPFATYATIARSPMIVAVVAVLGWLLIRNFSKARYSTGQSLFSVLLAAMICLFVIVSFDALMSLVVGRTDIEISSSQSRNTMIIRGLDAIAQRPIFGYGSGQSAIVAGLFGTGGFLTIDNLYLSEAIDNGLIGLALFVGFLGAVLMSGFSLAKQKRNDDLRGLVIALTAAVGAIAVGQFVLSITDNLSLVYITAGLFVALRSMDQKQTPIISAGNRSDTLGR